MSGKDTTTGNELLPSFGYMLIRKGEVRYFGFEGAQLAEQTGTCKPWGLEGKLCC